MSEIEVHKHATRKKTRSLIESSFLIALVFVATLFLNIRLPIAANGGLVHLGSAMLFICAILFGPRKGAIAGAFGMGLFDLVSGWTLWAPFTFITRGIQGFIVGYIAHSTKIKCNETLKNTMAIFISVPPMLAGYYVFESILFKSWIIPLASIPGNLVQSFIGLAVALPLAAALAKLKTRK